MAIKEQQARAVIEQAVGKIINLCVVPDGYLALADTKDGQRVAVVYGKECPMVKYWKAEQNLQQDGLDVAVLPLNANNAALVRHFVKWTAPSACGTRGVSVGITDGEAGVAAGVVGEFQNRQMKPVLVDCTPGVLADLQRNYLNAVDDATWGVLAANYRDGYGANAAGLTTEEEIVKALLYNYSMIGFDPSGKISQENAKLDDGAIEKKFEEFPIEFQAAVNASYLKVEFQAGKYKISFRPEEVRRIVLEYGEVIMHTQFIYNSYFKSTPWPVDFMLELRRPGRALTVQEHYLIANELQRNGIRMATLLLDARDGMTEEELAIHAAIADTFEYRLAIDHADEGLNPAALLKAAKYHAAHFKVPAGRVQEFLKKI